MPQSDLISVATGAPAPRLLRYSAGFVYFYFGFLKFYTDLSPAEMLASQTIMRIWPWQVDAHQVLLGLAVAEVVIGLAFLFNVGLQWIIWVFFLHQFGTFLPLVLIPELCFKIAPFSPTMEGQYILKNLVSFAAGLTVMLPAVRAARARAKLKKIEEPEQRRAAAAGAPAESPRPAPVPATVSLSSTRP